MTVRSDILDEIARLQTQLATLNRVPSDTFPIGSIVVFASGIGGKNKWYYVKTAEETWRYFVTNVEKDLASWILEATEASIGYFEVYVLTVNGSPIFASA
jgi:hypothetical protein